MTEYIHFSARPQTPQVPPRAINFGAGGTGPLGVYAYPMDAQMTFAAERKYSFVLIPTTPILQSWVYLQAQLDADVRTLSTLVDLGRPLRLWAKFERESRDVGPPFRKLWYLISKIPSPTSDPDELPGAFDSGFAAPELGRQLFISLGFYAVEDRYGIMYASEPKQIVFLTDDSFQVIGASGP